MIITNRLEETIKGLETDKSKLHNKMNDQQPQIQFRLKVAHLFNEYLDKHSLSVKALYEKLIAYYGKENINFSTRTFQKLVSDTSWQGGTNRDEGLKSGKLKILLICRDVLGLPIREFLQIREVAGQSTKKPSLRTLYLITARVIGNDFSIFKLWPIMQALGLNLSHIDALFEIVHDPDGGFNNDDKGWLLAPPVYDDGFGWFVNPLIAQFERPFSLSVEIYLPLPQEMPLIEKLVLHKSNAVSPFQKSENLGWYCKAINKKITTKLLTEINIKCVSTMDRNTTRIKLEGLSDNETN